MRFILRKKPEKNLNLNSLKDLRELLSLHDIIIVDDTNFPNMILIAATSITIVFSDWDVFPEKTYKVLDN